MEVDEDVSPGRQGGASGTVPTPGSGGDAKKTRSQKTPLQKEVLEASYQLNPNPNEEHRRALGERIGLDEKQVSAWFINRRRKEKRAEENRQIALAVQQNMASGAYGQSTGGTPPASTPTPPQPPAPAIPAPSATSIAQPPVPAVAVSPLQDMPSSQPAAMQEQDPAMPQASLSPTMHALHPHHISVIAGPSRTTPPVSSQSDMPSEAELQEYAQLLQVAQATLPEGLIPNGPPLGAVFDEIPNTQQGVGIKRKRVALDNFVADADTMAHHQDPAVHPSALKPYQRAKGLDRSERERTRVDEERMREFERAERERRKAMDRMDKERAKEEARRLREQEKQRIQQEKERRKQEAQAEKERRAEDKKKEREEKKREKELAKAAGISTAGASRYRTTLPVGPPDDEEVELEMLLQEQRRAAGLDPATGLPYGSAPGTPAPRLPTPVRPEFPPRGLNLSPAFNDVLDSNGLGADLVMVSGFLHTFSDVFGLRPTPSVDQLAQALLDGSNSPVLAAVHSAMLKLLQADMEEAHASGATASVGGPGTLVDRALVVAAHQLEAAWAWGYDIDVWRAHLNISTWPEVLREMAVAMTLQPEKKTPKRSGRPGPAHARPKIGEAGEDLYEDQAGGLKLRLPARYTVGSVKAAAWQVLAECGTEGLMINEIAKRIQEAGYRDLRAAKTPEASVAGALSRDMLFVRIAPSTFALASILQHWKRLGLQPPKDDSDATKGKEEVKQEGDSAVKTETKPVVKQEADANGNAMDIDTPQPGSAVKTEVKKEDGTPAPDTANGEDDEYNSGDEEYDEEGNLVEQAAIAYSKEPWVNTLAATDYDALSLRERADALCWLMHSVLDGPTIRAVIDQRTEDVANIKKQMVEDAKNEKRQRQIEAATKAKQAAEEAKRKLEELQAAGGQLPGPGMSMMHTDNGLMDATAAAQMAMEAAAVAAQRATMANTDDGEEEKLAKIRRQDATRRLEEEKAIRIDPLGGDRRNNKYYNVTAIVTPDGLSAIPDSNPEATGDTGSAGPNTDPSAGRVFVQAPEDGSWRLMSHPQQLDQLRGILEPRGAREGMLTLGLQQHGKRIKASMPSRPVVATLPQNGLPSRIVKVWDKLFELLRPYALACTPAQPNIQTPATEPPRVQKLKRDMAAVANALPPQSVLPNFDRQAWIQSVADAPNPSMLRRYLGQLESAILPAYLSAAFQRNPTIHRQAWSSPLRLQQEAEAAQVAQEAGQGTVSAIAEPLSWLPPTYAAVALRLQALDASLYYTPTNKCGRDRLLGYRYIQRPGTLPRPSDGAEPPATSSIPQAEYLSPELGGIAVACVQGITTSGRPRHVLIFPLLPIHTLCAGPRDFELHEINAWKDDVAEAEEAGNLYPAALPISPIPSAPGQRVPGARAAAAQLSAFSADRLRRATAMQKASAMVRSAYARATQARLGGGRTGDKLSRARTVKARKVRQSNLTREHERQKSDDEGDAAEGAFGPYAEMGGYADDGDYDDDADAGGVGRPGGAGRLLPSEDPGEYDNEAGDEDFDPTPAQEEEDDDEGY